MATIQTINVGTYSNDGTGDDLRTAFEKVNANFTSINSELGITSAENLGTVGVGIYASKTNNVLKFKKLTGSNGVTITSPDANTVNISALASVEGDTDPTLGANLDLNGYNIEGLGDVQTTVWGLDIRTMYAQLQSIAGNDVDFGSFSSPSTVNLDFGTF